MTRSEAAQKWCPFSRDVQIVSGSMTRQQVNGSYSENVPMVVAGNRQYGSPHAGAMCIHEKCMMWRAPIGDPDVGHCGYGS